MIPDTNIKAIISELASQIGLTIIRADQQGKHPPYPFASYKNILSQQENPHQDNREIQENAIDPTSVDIRTSEKSEETISLTFLNKNNVSQLKTLATNALRWFKSIAGRKFCLDNSIVVRIISPGIEDRTVYQEAFYENKIGFDVRFDYSALITETLEGIDQITIGVERDDVAQDDLVVTIP